MNPNTSQRTPDTTRLHDASGETLHYDAFDVRVMDELRAKQLQRLLAVSETTLLTSDKEHYQREYAKAISDFPEMIDRFLSASDIGADHPKRAVYEALASEFSLDRVHDGQWYVGKQRDDGTVEQSPREQFVERLATLEAEGAAAKESDPAIEQAREKLASLQDKLAAITAKRQGQVVSLSNKAYETARDEYNEQLQKLAKLELADTLRDATITDSQKNVAAIDFILQRDVELRAKTREALSNTKASKFIDWMNKGIIAQRTAKGMGLGLVVGAAAGLIGTAAAGVAGVGTAAVLANRFARSFARSDHKRGRGMSETAQIDKRLAMQHLEAHQDDRLAAAAGYLDTRFDDDTHKEQMKRRKSSAVALGGIALGGALGAVAHEFDIFGKATEWAHHVYQHVAGHDAITDTTSTPGASPEAPAVGDTPPVNDNLSPLFGDGPDSTVTAETIPVVFTPESVDIQQLSQFNEWIGARGTVQPGDTIWAYAKDYLMSQGNLSPSNTDIDHVKDLVLADWQAKGMADGRGWIYAGDIIKVK